MLSETQIERYSRQIILPQVGGRGQEKLLAAGVAIVADGAASSTIAVYLAAAGVGRLAIADRGALGTNPSEDDAANSGRQAATAGGAFTPPALAALNPDCAVRRLRAPHTSDEAFAVASQYDLVIVCEVGSLVSTEATASTAYLNAACVQLRKPLLWARVDGVVGCLTQVAGERASAPCYQCVLPQLARLEVGAAPAPWAAALSAGVVGSVQATEALKILLGIDATLAGRLVIWNGLGATIREQRVVRDPGCATCSATVAAPWRVGAV